MFGLGGFRGSVNPFEQTGTVAFNTDFDTCKKPLWLISLKLLGVAAMVAVGAAIAVPTLLELQLPLWQAIAYTVGGMVAYTGIGFFVRPEANTDNLGWGGGMGNDPFRSSDNANRFLWRLHCLLGPGRFTAETFLDTCVFVGLIKVEEQPTEPPPGHSFAAFAAGNFGAASAAGAGGVAAANFPATSDPLGFDPTRPIAPLDPSRFALSSANSVMEKIQRDSQRYPASSSPAAAR
jgi:hypothetical protein